MITEHTGHDMVIYDAAW